MGGDFAHRAFTTTYLQVPHPPRECFPETLFFLLNAALVFAIFLVGILLPGVGIV
jgi:hypothetical protein